MYVAARSIGFTPKDEKKKREKKFRFRSLNHIFFFNYYVLVVVARPHVLGIGKGKKYLFIASYVKLKYMWKAAVLMTEYAKKGGEKKREAGWFVGIRRGTYQRGSGRVYTQIIAHAAWCVQHMWREGVYL